VRAYFTLQNYLFVHNNVGALDARVICSVNKLLELFGKICHERQCNKEYHVTTKSIGCCLRIDAQCSNGHRHIWLSSDKIPSEKGEIYRDNLDFASAVVLSGNHFAKIQQFCQFLNVATLSRTSYYSYQRLYICPAIDQYFAEQQVTTLSCITMKSCFVYLGQMVI